VPELGRVLGLDPGDARIGVAISDPDRRVAVPFGTVHVGQPPGELKAIAAIVSNDQISVVVVGLPRELSGEEGPRAGHARAFAGALGGFLDVPIDFQDERLSTVEAERLLRGAGVVGRQRRKTVDQTAATLILQAWLDRHTGR
jgi:putative Holliday junction resolvase